MIGVSLGSNDGKLVGSDEGTKPGIYDGTFIVSILGNVYGITLGFDVGKKLGSLDGFIDGYNYGNLEGLLLRGLLEYNEVVCPDEGIKQGISNDKVLRNIPVNVDKSLLVVMLEQSWDIYMDPLMVLTMTIFRDYLLKTKWDILMVKCLALTKELRWLLMMVKLLAL